jgi:hypothetical protein
MLCYEYDPCYAMNMIHATNFGYYCIVREYIRDGKLEIDASTLRKVS